MLEPLLDMIIKLAGFKGASIIAASPPSKAGEDFDTVRYVARSCVICTYLTHVAVYTSAGLCDREEP